MAKTQCQNSADAAAMAGARAWTARRGQNIGDVNTPGTSMYIAQNTAQANQVLTNTIPAANITLTYGAWHYDTASQLFMPQFPPVAPDNYNLVQVNVSYSRPDELRRSLQVSSRNPGFSSLITVQAQAQAAHRPRDVAIDPRLFRVDEQRERPVELRVLPRQRLGSHHAQRLQLPRGRQPRLDFQ